MGTHPIFESDFDCLTDMSRGVNDAKVYIGNLGSDPPSTTEVEKEFSYYGKLQSVWIARRPPGFAYVEFEDGRDARDACKDLDGRTVFGRRIKVEISHGKSESQEDLEVQEEEDQEVQEDVPEVQEENQEADHVVVDHDRDLKVAEHAVLQATAAAKNQSKSEVLDHQKDENDQDPDQLVLQSQLPQNPDPEADPKIVFHCLP